MKTLIISILILNACVIKAQTDKVLIKEGYSNLVILVTDFVSNKFEGGTIYQLPKSNVDSLLFQVDYHPPSDFGSIEFKHQPSKITVFKGGIVWDGLGEIKIPEKITSPSEFSISKSKAKLPKQYQYFEYEINLKSYFLEPKLLASELSHFYIEKKYIKEFEKLKSLEDVLARAWKSIEKLKIVNEMAIRNCKTGFYLYTPSVGMFNPTAAKWIIFLYLN